MSKIYGLFLVCLALAIYTAAISIGIAWFAFCFGTIFIGILLLIFAPLLLLFPPLFVFSLGHAPMAYGIKLLTKSKQVLLEEQLSSINKKMMEFDKELLDYYTKKYYHTHENRALYPQEWEKCKAYHKAFSDTVVKHNELHHKLNPNALFVSTSHVTAINRKKK